MLYGIYIIVRKYYKSTLFVLLSWTLLIFLYLSFQHVQVMRYFIYLYPYFAIYAGLGISHFMQKKSLKVGVIVILLLLLWPLMFFSIYAHPHSRITASAWIYKNIPSDKLILSEHWDDGLPLSWSNVVQRSYRSEQLPVFDEDNNEKWQKMEDLLKRGDYLILSSNRGWGSISRVPGRYPRMSKFYADLFAGQAHYQKVEEFTSYPSLKYMGINVQFSDQWSDESFTVYDHPQVIIFKKYSQ